MATTRALLTGALLMLLAGCSEEPLPGQQLRSHECLQNITLDKLPEHISHCDAVVAAFLPSFLPYIARSSTLETLLSDGYLVFYSYPSGSAFRVCRRAVVDPCKPKCFG